MERRKENSLERKLTAWPGGLAVSHSRNWPPLLWILGTNLGSPDESSWGRVGCVPWGSHRSPQVTHHSFERAIGVHLLHTGCWWSLTEEQWQGSPPELCKANLMKYKYVCLSPNPSCLSSAREFRIKKRDRCQFPRESLNLVGVGRGQRK